MQDAAAFFLGDSREADLLDGDLGLGQVDRRRMVDDSRLGLSDHKRRDGFEQFFVGNRILIALVDDIIDTGIVEREHVIALQGVMDIQVSHFLGRSESMGREEGDGLEQEIYRGIQFVEPPLGGHFGADDDVRPHFPGKVDREVVAHAAIQQHFPTIADRTEIERNGHGRPHGRGDLTSRPILGSQSVEVGRDAGIGNGQVSEADAVLVTHAYGAERVAHIEAV